MTTQFDNNVPIPPARSPHNRTAPKYDLRNMSVGQSKFFAPEDGVSFHRMRTRISSNIAAVKRMNPGYDFTSRRLIEDGVDGLRVWRTA